MSHFLCHVSSVTRHIKNICIYIFFIKICPTKCLSIQTHEHQKLFAFIDLSKCLVIFGKMSKVKPKSSSKSLVVVYHPLPKKFQTLTGKSSLNSLDSDITPHFLLQTIPKNMNLIEGKRIAFQ